MMKKAATGRSKMTVLVDSYCDAESEEVTLTALSFFTKDGVHLHIRYFFNIGDPHHNDWYWLGIFEDGFYKDVKPFRASNYDDIIRKAIKIYRDWRAENVL